MKRYKNLARATMLLLLTMLTSNYLCQRYGDTGKYQREQVMAIGSIKKTDFWRRSNNAN